MGTITKSRLTYSALSIIKHAPQAVSHTSSSIATTITAINNAISWTILPHPLPAGI